jgi:dihydrolipoamide dehydrogenase
MPDAEPDGERILTWEQLYALPALPEHLIVVGSGVTGAEFASAYRGLGSQVTLVSSRDRVLPSEDADAARVIEEVFAKRGITVLQRSRATSAHRTANGVTVTLTDGRTIEGSHVLMAVGSLPNGDDLGLETAGVATDDRGFIVVDRVSRTSARGVYAAGDVTGVNMLASVAAMQGRIAMWHALGDAVLPLEVTNVSSTVFTAPEISTVGVSQAEIDSGDVRADVYLMPLATNARAKMEEIEHGFVKIICRRSSRIVAGAVVVSPHASELIHPLTIAVEQRLTVDQLAQTFTIYPSLSGSIAEAARRLHLSAE